MNDRSLILATVIDVNRGPISYPSCSFCHSKVHEDSSSGYRERSFVCSKCKKTIPNSEVNHRYRVSLRIAEDSTECDVTIFGSCLDKVLGAAADKFVQFQHNLQQNGFSSNQVQDLILQVFSDSLIGQKYYFGFRIPGPKTAKGRTLKYVIETAPSCGIVAHQIVTIDDPIRSVYADFKSEAEKVWRQCQTQPIQNPHDNDLDLTISQNIFDNRSAFDFSSMSSVNYSNQQLSLGLSSFETSVLSQGVTPRSAARISNMSCNSSAFMRKQTISARGDLNTTSQGHLGVPSLDSIPVDRSKSVKKGNQVMFCTSKLHSENPSESLFSKHSQSHCANRMNESDKPKTDVPKISSFHSPLIGIGISKNSLEAENCDKFSEESQIPHVNNVSKSVDTRQSMNFLQPPVNWKYKSRIPVPDHLSESLKESVASCVGSNISKSSYALHRQSSSVRRVGSRSRIPKISGVPCVSRASTMANIPSEIFSETLLSVDSQASKAHPVVKGRNQSAVIRTCALNSDSVTCMISKLQTENFSESLFSQESQFDNFLGFADVDAIANVEREKSSCAATHERNKEVPTMKRSSEHLFSEEIPAIGVANASVGCDSDVMIAIEDNYIQKDFEVSLISKACTRKTTTEEANTCMLVSGKCNDSLFSEEIQILGDANASKGCDKSDIARNVEIERKFEDIQKEFADAGNDSLFSEEISPLGFANSSRGDSAVKGGIKENCFQKDCAITSKTNASCTVTLEKTPLQSVADENDNDVFRKGIPYLDDRNSDSSKNLDYKANFKKPEVPTFAPYRSKSAVNVDLKEKTKRTNLYPETFCMWSPSADCSDYVVMPEDEDEIAQHRRNKVSDSRAVQELNPPESEQLDEFLGRCDDNESTSCCLNGNNSTVVGFKTCQRSASGVGEHANLSTCLKGGVGEAAPPDSENIDEFLGKCDDAMSDSEMCSSSFEDSKLLLEVFALENDMVSEAIPKYTDERTSDGSSGCKKDLADACLEKVLEFERSCTADSVLDVSCDLFTPTPKSFHLSRSRSQKNNAGKCDIDGGNVQSPESAQADSGLGNTCSASRLQDKHDGVPSQQGRYLEPKKLMVQFVEESQEIWSQDLFSSQSQAFKSPSVCLGSNDGQRNDDKTRKGLSGCQQNGVELPVAYMQKIPNNEIVCGLTVGESPGIVFKTPLKSFGRKSKTVLNQTSTPLSFRNASNDLKRTTRDQGKSGATGIASPTSKYKPDNCKNRTPIMPVLNSAGNFPRRPKSLLKSGRTSTFSPMTTRCKVLKMSDKSNLSVFDSPIRSFRKTVQFVERFLHEDKENSSCLSDSVLLLAAEEDGDVGGSKSYRPVGAGSIVETRSKCDSPCNQPTPISNASRSMYQDHSPDLFSSMDESMFEANEPHEQDFSPFQMQRLSKSRRSLSQRRASLLGDKALPALSFDMFDVSGDLFSD